MMMNLDAEAMRLIDVSSEDDFLIDSHLDGSSFDLRLSVACETQNELVSGLGRARLRAKDALPLSSAKEQETFRLERENIDNECSLRKSLAWDSAFFTSPGFLELEELCLVNRGFKNSEAVLSCGNEESTRSKICVERNSSHKPAVRAGSRLRTQTLIKPKLVSPSKTMTMQDSKPQNMPRRSPAIPRVVSKPQAVQSFTDRRELLKSTRSSGLTRVSATHMKKSPVKVVKSGDIPAAERLVALKSRRPDSRSVSCSVSSSQSALSPIASSNSIDLSPHRNCSYDARSANLQKSPVTQGECPPESLSPASCDSRKTGDIEGSPQDSSQQVLIYNVNESQNMEDQEHHRSPIEQGSLRKSLLRQSAPTSARRSPLFSDTSRSSKPSSLRVPSQKIGFFDMKSEVPEPQSSFPEVRVRNSLRSSHSKEDEPKNKLKTLKSKEGPQASLNQKAHTGDNGKMCNENLETGTKAQRRRNQHKHHFEKKTGFSRIEEKENIFHPDDTMIELEIKQGSPSPSKPRAKTDDQCSSSSGKHLLKTRKPMQKTKPSIASARIPFSTKGSPLKRSAFF